MATVGQRVDQRKVRGQAARHAALLASGTEVEAANSRATVAAAGQPDGGRGASEEVCIFPHRYFLFKLAL